MKALTIQQPWAALIAAGVKLCENRTWNTSYRGLLAIHAGSKRHPRGGEEEAEYSARLDAVPGCRSLGRIVAVATLCNVLSYEDVPDEFFDEQFAFVEGPFCWILADVTPIPEAVQPYVRGSLGLWNLSEEQAQIVMSGTWITKSTARR